MEFPGMSRVFISSLLFLTLSLPLRGFAQNQSPLNIKIGGSYVLCVLPMLAIEQEFFKQQNLHVEFERIKVGKLAMDAVVSGALDLGCVVDTNLAMNSFHGSKLRAIATIISDYDNGIAFLKGKGISSFDSLKGHRIGYLPATTSHSLLLHELDKRKWKFSDIQAVPLQPASMLPALRSGSVDAVSIWNPWRYEILKSLDSKVQEIPNTKEVYQPMGYLAATSTTIETKAEEIRRVFLALEQAEAYALKNLPVVKQRFAVWNNMEGGALESLWQSIRLRLDLRPEALQAVEKDIALIKAFDRRFKNRRTRPISEIFDAQPLRTIFPQRVGKL